MSRRLTDMRWDAKGNPANLQAAAADALLWLDAFAKVDKNEQLSAVIKQLERFLGVDARTKDMP